MIDAVNEDELDTFNEINHAEIIGKQNDYLNDANLLRVKHRDIRDNYDRLDRIAAKGPNSRDFIEPKVQSLWRIATHSNFSTDELASLKVLSYYHKRSIHRPIFSYKHSYINNKTKVISFPVFSHIL